MNLLNLPSICSLKKKVVHVFKLFLVKKSRKMCQEPVLCKFFWVFYLVIKAKEVSMKFVFISTISPLFCLGMHLEHSGPNACYCCATFVWTELAQKSLQQMWTELQFQDQNSTNSQSKYLKNKVIPRVTGLPYLIWFNSFRFNLFPSDEWLKFLEASLYIYIFPNTALNICTGFS